MSLCKCTSPECGEHCNNCYRFRCIGNEYWQPYAEMYEPHPNDPNIKCLNFVALEGRKNLLPIEEDGQSN